MTTTSRTSKSKPQTRLRKKAVTGTSRTDSARKWAAGKKAREFPRSFPLARLHAALDDPHDATAGWLWWMAHLVYSETAAGLRQDAAPWKLVHLLDARRECASGVEPVAAVLECEAERGEPQRVLALRGVEPLELLDWAVRHGFDLEEWSGGREARVHAGFQQALRSPVGTTRRDRTTGRLPCRGTLEEVLLEVSHRKPCRTWITGHSSGGALATLLAASLAEEGLARHVEGVYTFGQPRVGDETFRYVYEEELGLGSRTFRIVNDLDVVPRIPFDSSGVGGLNPLGWLMKTGNVGDLGFLGELEVPGDYRHVGVEVKLAREVDQRFTGTPRAPSEDMVFEAEVHRRAAGLRLPFFLRLLTDHLRPAYRDKVWS